MKTDSTPATKADISELKADIGKLTKAIGSLQTDVSSLRADTETWKNEILHHFDVALENHHRDAMGVYGDRYQSLRDVQRRHGLRLNRLETRVGVYD